MTYLALGCTALLAFVFAASALGKIRSPGEFRASLPRLVPVPAALAGPLAGAVIAVEGLTALLLALPVTRPAGLWLALALTLAFCGVVEHAVRQGAGIPCRCFGASSAPLGRRHLVRNGVLAASALTALLTGGARGADPAGVAVALAGAACAALLVVRFDDVVELFA
ncbi:MauE/DoxX family redox-associated membrane protein [Nonomuraea longicatena]|uniref:Methylamine utilization protein MauE n=1 Tax=Nonomuraea longicatena TaxID=83682 RepID=A0ABN1PIE6_9ACTN